VKAWLAEVLPKFVRRQHLIGQSEVVLDGDAATVRAYFANPMVTVHDGVERLFACGGRYITTSSVPVRAGGPGG
jgi:hypothetical protein